MPCGCALRSLDPAPICGCAISIKKHNGGLKSLLTEREIGMASTQLMDLIIARVNRKFNAAFPGNVKDVDGVIEELCGAYQNKPDAVFNVVALLRRAQTLIKEGLSVSSFRTILLPDIISAAVRDELDNHWMYKGVLANVQLGEERKFIAVFQNKYCIKLQIKAIAAEASLDRYKTLIFTLQSGQYEEWLKLHLDETNSFTAKQCVLQIMNEMLIK